jgi:ATP-dependent RNA helicase DDX54/DBP10
VLSPTRELALQTFKFAQELCKFTDLRTICIVGGDSMDAQFDDLASNPDLIVATPGGAQQISITTRLQTFGSTHSSACT